MMRDKRGRITPVMVLFIILGVVLLGELTLMNRPYYAHFFQGEETARFETQYIKELDGAYVRDDNMSGGEVIEGFANIPVFVFAGLDRRVNSVYIEPALFKGAGTMSFAIVYGDEDASRKSVRMTVSPGVKDSYYQEINPYGKVSYLAIVPEAGQFAVAAAAVNKPIPFAFNVWRVLWYTLLAYAVIALIRCNPMNTLYKHNDNRQKAVLAGILAAFSILAMLVTSSIALSDQTEPYESMVNALLEGRLDLGVEAPPALAAMENPYDYTARDALGLPDFADDEGVLLWDNAYYNGKFYMQHGIVPVVTMYLPFYLMTGLYLTNAAAVWLATTLSGVFLALLWRKIVAVSLKNMPFVMYICTTIAVLFVSMIFCGAWLPRKYEVSSLCAMMYAMLGLWFIFPDDTQKSKNHPPLIKIVLGTFCLALAVGCRPTFLAVSVFVPLLLWRYADKRAVKPNIRLALCAALPYIVVALPLMGYNYARFGNIADFGTYHVYHMPNAAKQLDLNPMGSLLVLFEALRAMLFTPISYAAGFPFALNSGSLSFGSAYPIRYTNSLAGLICFPVLWSFAALPLVKTELRAESLMTRRILLIAPAVGLCLGWYAYFAFGMSIRYQIDYMWLMLLPALFIMYRLWERFGRNAAFAKVLCAVCILSAAIAAILPSEDYPFSTLTSDAYHFAAQLFAP